MDKFQGPVLRLKSWDIFSFLKSKALSSFLSIYICIFLTMQRKTFSAGDDGPLLFYLAQAGEGYFILDFKVGGKEESRDFSPPLVKGRFCARLAFGKTILVRE